MSINDKPADTLAGIDKDAIKRDLIDGCRAAGPMQGIGKSTRLDEAKAHFRGRSPAELGEQLARDATSLTLTGEGLETDKAFYQRVSANIREAAAWLAGFQPSLDAIHKDHEHAREEAVRLRTFRTVIIAATVRDLLQPSAGEPAATWRAACSAIHSALLTLRDSPRSAGVDLAAAQPDMVEDMRAAAAVGRVVRP